MRNFDRSSVSGIDLSIFDVLKHSPGFRTNAVQVTAFQIPGTAFSSKGIVGMSRLHQPPAPHRSGDDHKGSRSIGANLTTPPAIEFPHRLFVPEHYEASYAYPLLVWLHSDHSSEYELDGLMQSLSLRNYAAVAIRGNRTSQIGRAHV